MRKAFLVLCALLLTPAFSSAEPTKAQKIEKIQIAYKKLKEYHPWLQNLSVTPVNLEEVKGADAACDKWFADLKAAHFESKTQRDRLYEDARINMYKAMASYKTYLEGTYKAWSDVREETIDRNNLIIEAAQRDLQAAHLWLDHAGSQIAEADSLP